MIVFTVHFVLDKNSFIVLQGFAFLLCRNTDLVGAIRESMMRRKNGVWRFLIRLVGASTSRLLSPIHLVYYHGFLFFLSSISLVFYHLFSVDQGSL